MIHTPRKEEENVKSIIIAIVLVLTIILFAVTYNNYSRAQEKQSPSLDIIKITCDNCFDLSVLDVGLAKSGAVIQNQKTFDYKTTEAQKIIAQYGITKVPAIIALSKDMGKITLDTNYFTVAKDVAIFEKGVPYVDISSNEMKGLVHMKVFRDSSCKECASLSPFKSQLEKAGITISEYQEINASSNDAIIKSDNIEFLPTFVVSKNIEEYWWIFDALKPSLKRTQDGYILSAPISPYEETSTGKIKGLVTATYITNKSCTDCFNISTFGNSFRKGGVFIVEEKYIDISTAQGKNVVKEYNITSIPTIILSKELSEYQQITKALESLGTFEKDGSYIFRKTESIQGKFQTLGDGK